MSSSSAAGLLNFISSAITAAASANSSSASLQNPFPFDPGFNISAVSSIAQALPSHSWEFGAATEALLELYNPAYSVFGPNPFPVPTMNVSTTLSLSYAQSHIAYGINGLSNGDGAVGDPASLGVGAVMLAKSNNSFAVACQEEIDYIISGAPRWPNGAISQRADVAELWADFMFMAPPYIAYFAADTDNETLLETAYRQSGLYREVLLFGTNSSTPSPLNTSASDGRWHHIVGPQSADPGLWSTGNGWAAAGMARVLATVIKAPIAQNATWQADAIADLTGWIKEIIDGARRSPADGGLLRNYLDTTEDGHGFGEISGSSLIASVAYRMVILAPKAFPASTYVAWADGVRLALGQNDHVTSNGTVTPAVNPLGWQDTNPWTAGSPEGQNFVVLMYAAWRDCIWAGICSED
ncbi:family 88 glycosyl hydrolase [Mycena amicta]|nr:family 88 glycosyl hydrolase [Mycena amicta]